MQISLSLSESGFGIKIGFNFEGRYLPERKSAASAAIRSSMRNANCSAVIPSMPGRPGSDVESRDFFHAENSLAFERIFVGFGMRADPVRTGVGSSNGAPKPDRTGANRWSQTDFLAVGALRLARNRATRSAPDTLP